jgi:hypothetical protein
VRGRGDGRLPRGCGVPPGAHACGCGCGCDAGDQVVGGRAGHVLPVGRCRPATLAMRLLPAEGVASVRAFSALVDAARIVVLPVVV